MVNILPPDAERRVWRMYVARFALALALAVFALTALLALALIPSYLALTFAAPPELSATHKEAAPGDPQALARAGVLVSHLLPVLSATTSPGELIEAGVAAQPPGLIIHHISYIAASANTSATVLLVGDAARDKIAMYRDALAADPHFANVSIPVDALIGVGSGNFSVTLSVKK